MAKRARSSNVEKSPQLKSAKKTPTKPSARATKKPVLEVPVVPPSDDPALMNPWKRLNTEKIYDNPWISLREDKVLKPNGEPGIYGVVHFKNVAMGIVALTRENEVVLIGQYRYPLGRYSWEIPEGGCPETEQPLKAAKRELEEEAGLRARKWTKILDMDLSNSSTDERAVVYLATDLYETKVNPEDTEVLEIRRVKLTKAVEMVLSGEITDGISVAALLHCALTLRPTKRSK